MEKLLMIAMLVTPLTINAAVISHQVNEPPGIGNEFIKVDSSGEGLLNSAKQWNCVFDAKTNLLWEVKTKDGGERDYRNQYRWKDWQSLVRRANAERLCGFSDWRLPSIKELKTISSFYSTLKFKKKLFGMVDAIEYKDYPSSKAKNGIVFLNPFYFPTAKLLKFNSSWSTTVNQNESNRAWIVNFNSGREWSQRIYYVSGSKRTRGMIDYDPKRMYKESVRLVRNY